MEQKFIILCHYSDGGEYLFKASFDSIARVYDVLKLMSGLSSYQDVVSFEVIDVCHFDRNVRISREIFVSNEK